MYALFTEKESMSSLYVSPDVFFQKFFSLYAIAQTCTNTCLQNNQSAHRSSYQLGVVGGFPMGHLTIGPVLQKRGKRQ